MTENRHLYIFLGALCILWKSTLGLVHSPPLMIKEPKPGEELFQVVTSPTENDKPFIIECEAEAEPSPSYRWIKNGKEFKYQTYDDRISQQPGRGSLVIKSPRSEDAGQYQCFAENKFGTATSNSVFLRMAELNPFKTSYQKTIQANQGQPFKLDCNPPDGFPKPIVTWIIEDSGNHLNTVNNSRVTIDPEGNLWFSHVTYDDRSVHSSYRCLAHSTFRNEFKLGTQIVLTVNSGTKGESRDKISPRRQYVSRKNEVAYRGEKVELFCIFGGNPEPKIQWTKDDKSVEYHQRGRVSEGNFGRSLVIRHVNDEDAGHYTCTVSNGVGVVETYTIDLSVLSAPYFIEVPEKQIKAEGESVEFRCSAKGNPEPAIKWIYNGQPIEKAPLNTRRTVSANSIFIENLEKSDTANYGCNATNSFGYVYEDVYINVLAMAPEFVEMPHDLETVDGHDVTMICQIAGSPRPQIKWIKSDVELTGGRFTVLPNGNLVITNVGFSDMGTLTCYGENKLGAIKASASLSVKQRTKINPGSGPSDFEVKAGDSATFRCAAEKDESLDLTIEWERNGVLILTDMEPRFVVTNDNSLTITKTVELDNAIYTCVAKTRLDNATASATLIVQDRPNAPVVNKVTCGQKTATILWQPMGENRAPITRYTIEYNTSFTPDTWNIADSNVPPSVTQREVNLTPWSNYTFRVIAENKVGKSPPSTHFHEVCTTAPAVPNANPQNVMGEGSEPINMVISWTPMSQIQHHGPGFYYEVAYRLKELGGSGKLDFFPTKIHNWRTSEYVVNNLQKFKEYEIKVTAFNEMGQGPMPEVVIGYSGEDVPSEAVRNLTVLNVISATSANISWLPVNPSSLNGHFRGYKIQTWSDQDNRRSRIQEMVVSRNVTQTVIDKLTANSKNTIRIFVFNGKYNGPHSEEVSIDTPEGVPDAVESLSILPLGSSAFLLKWSPPIEKNGILTGYNIYYQTVSGTELGPLQERRPQINDPNRNQAKLAGLQAGTNYRVYINATTKAGEGMPNYAEKRTRGTTTMPPAKPAFTHYIVETKMFTTVRIEWIPCAYESECIDKPIGSHFVVKYRQLNAPRFDTETEMSEDYILIRSLNPNDVYEFVVVSVDGDMSTESDPQEVQTSASPLIKPSENIATAGWFVAMMLAIAFLLVMLILVIMVKKNRGGKYVVHEREAASGRDDFPEETGFNEYTRPLGGVRKPAAAPEPEERDRESMVEFDEADTDGMNEDGSFIGQYGQKRNSRNEHASTGFATMV